MSDSGQTLRDPCACGTKFGEHDCVGHLRTQLSASQADLANLRDKLADAERDNLMECETANLAVKRAGTAQAEVERLTKERDEARKLVYSDHESVWGPYHREKDGARHGGNVGAWYESAVFWRKRAEAAEQAGVVFGEFPDHFTANNQRAESAEGALAKAADKARRLRDISWELSADGRDDYRRGEARMAEELEKFIRALVKGEQQ